MCHARLQAGRSSKHIQKFFSIRSQAVSNSSRMSVDLFSSFKNIIALSDFKVFPILKYYLWKNKCVRQDIGVKGVRRGILKLQRSHLQADPCETNCLAAFSTQMSPLQFTLRAKDKRWHYLILTKLL